MEGQLPNTDVPNDTDWSCLYCAGPEEIILIVPALGWLLVKQQNQGDTDIQLQKYVHDIDWAFSHLITWVSHFGHPIVRRWL